MRDINSPYFSPTHCPAQSDGVSDDSNSEEEDGEEEAEVPAAHVPGDEEADAPEL